MVEALACPNCRDAELVSAYLSPSVQKGGVSEGYLIRVALKKAMG